MKKILFAGIVLMTLGLSAFSYQIDTFNASFQGAAVRLQWNSNKETGIVGYEVFRKKASEFGYSRLATINASGQNAYIFMDENLYKGDGAAESVSYRLTVKLAEGNENYYASIDYTPTAVQRSWGSIKSMFK